MNKLPPLKPPDSWERQIPIPREPGNAAEPRAREKEGSQRVEEKKVQGEEREESHNGRLSQLNCCAVMTSEGM